MRGSEVKPIEASVTPGKGDRGAVTGVATWLWNARLLEGSSAMSELDVIGIHIRAEQATEYERLFAERELPRWRECKARGAFLSAQISRVAFGTDDRNDVAKYVIAIEVPSHAAHREALPSDRPAVARRWLHHLLNEAGRRGSFSLCAAPVPVMPVGSARRVPVVNKDAARAAGHLFHTLENAPVVPGYGYRVSD
jgi:hypothetical protein